jgi:phage N-6-adenine-methyltransferase
VGVSPRHTSGSDEWGTPRDLFEELDREFGFTLDAAASSSNYKVANYYTKADDAIAQSWHTSGAVWLNPPYSRGLLAQFFEKAHAESLAHDLTVVLIVPPRTSTAYWHDHAMHADEIRMIRGRVGFVRDDGYQNAAPADSVLVIFKGKNGPPKVSAMQYKKAKR